jgi:dTDP-4-amino-4,6-dideoxygalactose transaminase
MPTFSPISGTGESGAVEALERTLRERFGARRALCVSSATTGLMAVALALGLRGEEFLTTPYTYGGTLAGWLALGNRPVFGDIEPDSLGLCAQSVRKLRKRSTRAILAVDIYGYPSDSEALRRAADDCGLWYVADAAQAFGARRGGRPASSLADAVVLSFTSGKPLDAGEGGAVLTDHDWLYERLIWFTQHPDRQKRELGLLACNEFAINGRMHPAAAQKALKGFDAALRSVETRGARVERLHRDLARTGLVEPPAWRATDSRPGYFRFVPAWRRRPAFEELRHTCPKLRLGPAPVRLLPQQGALLAQYPGLAHDRGHYPEAIRQSKVRFHVETDPLPKLMIPDHPARSLGTGQA